MSLNILVLFEKRLSYDYLLWFWSNSYFSVWVFCNVLTKWLYVPQNIYHTFLSFAFVVRCTHEAVHVLAKVAKYSTLAVQYQSSRKSVGSHKICIRDTFNICISITEIILLHKSIIRLTYQKMRLINPGAYKKNTCIKVLLGKTDRKS
jgi:hypothetical protein